MIPLRINVTTKGKPNINMDGAHTLATSEDICAVVIDMRSRRCDCDMWNNGKIPGLIIRATSESLHLNESATAECTIIEFPDLSGFGVWLCEVSRYTIRACLIRRGIDV